MKTKRGRNVGCFIGVLFFSVVYNGVVIGNAVMHGWRAAVLTVISGVSAVLAENLMDDSFSDDRNNKVKIRRCNERDPQRRV